MLKSLILLLNFVVIRNTMAAKILAVFPTPSTSHRSVYRTLTKELAARGHEITLITANPFPKGQVPENVTEIDFQNVSLKTWQKYSNTMYDQSIDVVTKICTATYGIDQVFEQQLKSSEMKRLMEEKHSYFDLLLLDASVTAIISLSHIFKSPAILISSMGAAVGNYEIMGAPIHPFLYPSNFRQRIYNLTVFEKINELYTYLRLKLKLKLSEEEANLMLRSHFGHDFPSLSELNNNVHMLFLNINPIWAGNQPVPPNVILMGGIQSPTTEELPQDLQSYIDKSRRDIVYVSFGDEIRPSLLHPNKIRILINALSDIPFNVILKWDVDRLPGVPKNIKVANWIPQSLLLKHQKIRLFISHGGLQSTDDAIEAGVPLIGIPMFADQWYNTEKYVHFQIGMQVDMASLSEHKLIYAIRTVIRDDRYRRNIAELRNLMYDRPQLPLESAIWWTEYVLRHGGALHLRSFAANISWAEYLEMKLLFTLLFILFIAIIFLIVFSRSLLILIHKGYTDVKKKVS